MRLRTCLIRFAASAAFLMTGSAYAQLPALGTSLPDVTVYDASGKSFNLTELRGSYSVLVFGCLT